MKQYLLILILVYLVSCTPDSNKEIVLKYKKAERYRDTDKMEKFLDPNVISLFVDSSGMLTREEILLNHLYSIPYEPKSKIISIKEPNDSTVELQVIESNKLLKSFNIDSTGYLYRYTITDSKIKKIVTDSIPNYGFNYKKTDSIYNRNLHELFNWIFDNYPEKYMKIEKLDREAAQIIIDMAELRKTEGNNGEHP